MKPMIQPGSHPDAQILSAFAEQQLSDLERKDVIAHMTFCGRCREVVFLAQKAMEAEEKASSEAQISQRKTGGGLLTVWRWSWIPVAALAGIVGFAVVRHMNRASVSETRMAQDVAPSKMVQSVPATKGAASPSPEPQTRQPRREQFNQKPAAHERSDRDAMLDRKSLDERNSLAQKKDDAVKETDSVSATAPQESTRSLNGTLKARAKTSAVGGPTAQNQVQQQNSTQLQQNYANEERQAGGLADSANKPISSAGRTGKSTQTIAVDAIGGPLPVSPAPSAAPIVPTAQIESAIVSESDFAKLKARSAVLPSKLGVISEATSAKRTLAVDTAGSLFLSEDAGKHWQTVNAIWSGRAVLVKVAPTAAAVGGVLKHSISRFELTTDKQEIWVSDDGKKWSLKAQSGK